MSATKANNVYHGARPLIKNLRHASLQLTFKYMYVFQISKNVHAILNEISLLKKYKNKIKFSNLVFTLARIIQMICINCISLESP